MPDVTANPDFSAFPKPVGRSPLVAYAVAVTAVFLAWALRASLTPLWGPMEIPFIFFYPAIVVSAWYGRSRAGLLAIVLSALVADWFFIDPVHSFWLGQTSSIVAVGSFVLVNLLLVAAVEIMHRAKDRVVTELARRQEAEAQLAAEKELLAITLTSMGDAVIVTDADGNITSLNREAERLTGWSSAEAVGRPHAEVFHILNETNRGPAENPIDKALNLGIVTGLANHTILIAKDGREIPIDDSAAPIRQENADAFGVVLVFRNVTEQRRAQRDRAQLAEIVKYSGDAIITKDLNGIIQTWNESAQRLFGYQPQEIIGRSATILFPPDRLHEEDGILTRLRQGQPSERIETIRVRNDGTPIHVSISVSPLKNAEGEIIGASKIIHDISELVAAREDLLREKQLLATTLASIGDGVILTDADGRVVFLNFEAERLTGWRTEEAGGRPLHEVFRIINEDTREAVENPVDKVMRLGGTVGLANHTLLIAKDGREIPIDDSAAPIQQPSGPMFGIVLVFRDFTERKNAEAALREREQRFRTMADSAPVMIWLSGLDKLCTWFNRQWLEFTGRTMEQEFGNGWAEGVHPDDFERCLKTYVESFDARQPFSMEYRLKRHDGEWRWILDHGTPIHEAGGVFTGYIGSCIDVTEQKLASDALRERTHELETLLNLLPVAVWIANDPECRDVRGNQYAQKLFGVPHDANMSQTSGASESAIEMAHFRNGRQLTPAEMPMQRAAITGEPQYNDEIEVQVPDGRRVIIGGNAVPVKDEQGKLRGVVAAFTDLTERKQVEAERERLLRSEQELRATAEEANRLKDEFLAIMSHELRNPLNVILGYSELLVRMEEIAESPQLHHMAEAIKRNAIAQSKLIRDLLDLSRLRSGKLELNLEPVSLRVAVENAIDTVRADADDRRLAIKVIADDEPLFVKADSVRLEQIVWNLLNNSVKFTPLGGKITVRVGTANGTALLAIEDTGQGIDPVFLPHVFEMFRQADGGTARAQSGMGIGLAVVQQLVDLHNGAISAHSDGAGKGATFRVTLPLSVDYRPITVPVLNLSARALTNMRVLVVDDSEDTAEMLRQLLGLSGATVIAATSGTDALNLAAKNEFDVILSDISMPGIDGFEFLRRLNKLPTNKGVPVLALTGFGRPEDIERAQTEGFFSHVTKPFELDSLLQILQRLPQKRADAGS